MILLLFSNARRWRALTLNGKNGNGQQFESYISKCPNHLQILPTIAAPELNNCQRNKTSKQYNTIFPQRNFPTPCFTQPDTKAAQLEGMALYRHVTLLVLYLILLLDKKPLPHLYIYLLFIACASKILYQSN